MENNNKNYIEKDGSKKKKKGILSSIWESMNKIGGCCGSSGECGCSGSSQDKNKGNKKQDGSEKI